MADRSPPDETGASGLEERRTELDTWLALWRLAVAVFVGLLALCGYWIAGFGFEGAIAQGRFHYVVFAAIIVGILILGRFTMRPFTRPFEIDRRNVATMMGRRLGNWFVPKSPDDGKR